MFVEVERKKIEKSINSKLCLRNCAHTKQTHIFIAHRSRFQSFNVYSELSILCRNVLCLRSQSRFLAVFFSLLSSRGKVSLIYAIPFAITMSCVEQKMNTQKQQCKNSTPSLLHRNEMDFYFLFSFICSLMLLLCVKKTPFRKSTKHYSA